MNDKLLREKWIDTLKGIAIFLVVLGHVLDGFIDSGFQYNGNFEVNVFRGIYIFHMPLFMAISGYVFALAYQGVPNDWGGVKIPIDKAGRYKRQICNLAEMYFIFSILMFGFKRVFNSHVNVSVGWWDLIKLPIKYIPKTPYWYLYVLVLSYLFAAYFLKQSWDKRVILCISFVVCMAYSALQLKEIILAQRIFYYFFFFMLGCSYKLYGHFVLEKNYLLQLVLSVALSWVFLFQENVLHGSITQLLRILVSILVINILFGICRKYMDRKGIFSFLGERSLEIYILHIYVTSGIRPILKIFNIGNFWLAVVIATFLGIVLPVICSYILKKMKLWDLFFRPATFLSNYRK